MMALKFGGIGLITLLDGWTFVGWGLLTIAILVSGGLALRRVHGH